jgi:hypothetical protein
MKKHEGDWQATSKCLMINLKQRVWTMTSRSLRMPSKELWTLIRMKTTR